MKSFKVQITPEAKDDLRRYRDYLRIEKKSHMFHSREDFESKLR